MIETFNLTSPVYDYITPVIDKCLTKEHYYSAECIYKNICINWNIHFLHVGAVIILSYAAFSWGSFFLFKYEPFYRKIPKTAFFGDFMVQETRIYWACWIRERFILVMLSYIAMMVYLMGGFASLGLTP